MIGVAGDAVSIERNDPVDFVFAQFLTKVETDSIHIPGFSKAIFERDFIENDYVVDAVSLSHGLLQFGSSHMSISISISISQADDPNLLGRIS